MASVRLLGVVVIVCAITHALALPVRITEGKVPRFQEADPDKVEGEEGILWHHFSDYQFRDNVVHIAEEHAELFRACVPSSSGNGTCAIPAAVADAVGVSAHTVLVHFPPGDVPAKGIALKVRRVVRARSDDPDGRHSVEHEQPKFEDVFSTFHMIFKDHAPAGMHPLRRRAAIQDNKQSNKFRTFADKYVTDPKWFDAVVTDNDAMNKDNAGVDVTRYIVGIEQNNYLPRFIKYGPFYDYGFSKVEFKYSLVAPVVLDVRYKINAAGKLRIRRPSAIKEAKTVIPIFSKKPKKTWTIQFPITVFSIKLSVAAVSNNYAKLTLPNGFKFDAWAAIAGSLEAGIRINTGESWIPQPIWNKKFGVAYNAMMTRLDQFKAFATMVCSQELRLGIGVSVLSNNALSLDFEGPAFALVPAITFRADKGGFSLTLSVDVKLSMPVPKILQNLFKLPTDYSKIYRLFEDSVRRDAPPPSDTANPAFPVDAGEIPKDPPSLADGTPAVTSVAPNMTQTYAGDATDKDAQALNAATPAVSRNAKVEVAAYSGKSGVKDLIASATASGSQIYISFIKDTGAAVTTSDRYFSALSEAVAEEDASTFSMEGDKIPANVLTPNYVEIGKDKGDICGVDKDTPSDTEDDVNNGDDPWMLQALQITYTPDQSAPATKSVFFVPVNKYFGLDADDTFTSVTTRAISLTDASSKPAELSAKYKIDIFLKDTNTFSPLGGGSILVRIFTKTADNKQEVIDALYTGLIPKGTKAPPLSIDVEHFDAGIPQQVFVSIRVDDQGVMIGQDFLDVDYVYVSYVAAGKSGSYKSPSFQLAAASKKTSGSIGMSYTGDLTLDSPTDVAYRVRVRINKATDPVAGFLKVEVIGTTGSVWGELLDNFVGNRYYTVRLTNFVATTGGATHIGAVTQVNIHPFRPAPGASATGTYLLKINFFTLEISYPDALSGGVANRYANFLPPFRYYRGWTNPKDSTLSAEQALILSNKLTTPVVSKMTDTYENGGLRCFLVEAFNESGAAAYWYGERNFEDRYILRKVAKDNNNKYGDTLFDDTAVGAVWGVALARCPRAINFK
eukprot:Opistho-1_new@30718